MESELPIGIAFQHPLGSAVLRDAERAHLSTTTTSIVDMAVNASFGWQAMVPLLRGAPEPLRDDEDVRLFFGAYGEPGTQMLEWAGDVIDVRHLRFNTMIATGSPMFALMAQLDAFCEEHAFVEAGDALWLAELVRSGREANILRPEHGWEKIAALCDQVVAAGGTAPIVTSYTFCRAFPNLAAANWAEPIDLPTWTALSDEERWDRAVAGIRAHSESLQIGPGSSARRLGNGRSAFDFGTYAHEQYNRKLMA